MDGHQTAFQTNDHIDLKQHSLQNKNLTFSFEVNIHRKKSELE